MKYQNINSIIINNLQQFGNDFYEKLIDIIDNFNY